MRIDQSQKSPLPPFSKGEVLAQLLDSPVTCQMFGDSSLTLLMIASNHPTPPQKPREA
jgi:hypothetical protein